ncbi:hypothetical protein [Kitasatospora sp. MAP5-34]|uniref:hypothetical protein n=1 Tax=Kitasatospora sp. MAP5-34 TaxID=3035102 RepID=UPI00247729FA|nr:hypothetical protein [Kitasatospora sp. MAP5-34]MDH6576994.1 hypothetical protein [Kitasatospora sp. MAP5-34]
MIRSHRVRAGRVVGGAALLASAAVAALGAPAANAAGPTGAPVRSPEPAAAQLTPPVTGDVGGSAGPYAVVGGLVVVAGGAATWLRRKRSGRVTVH